MKPIRLDTEAADELSAAYGWYEAQAHGLGDALIAAVDEQLSRIQLMPRRFGLAQEVARQLKVRRGLLRQFPFSIVFVELPDEIRVLAVAHQGRRPGYWRKRVRKRVAH